MKFYSEFTTKYVNDACQSLNAKFGNLSTLRDQSFTAENFETLTEFLQDYILYSSYMFIHLNNLGLVNQGKCPYSGQVVDHSSPSYSYMDRRVYLSEKGFSLMQKEAEEKRRSVFGF